jgi:hypothetical protein
MLTDRANLMLDAWDDGQVTDEDVRSWAGTELLSIADTKLAPTWLLDLVQHGPRSLADVGLEWRRSSGFKVRFAMRAIRLDLSDRPSVEGFAQWLAPAAMGEDLADPGVQLGYEVDHCLHDLGDLDLAVDCVRQGLPGLVERCRATIATILG